ncbi:MAG: hypothetical protein A3H42_01065 [Deltaproteobacteria bacterium RIFCSPLOWO2_02_FULL_46_8]|nr:MAG: hypothetical protein A3H42_01065 [Deltaproteobacteria bacterium RIFCSPLOWO2_02_FULL_46_8]
MFWYDDIRTQIFFQIQVHTEQVERYFENAKRDFRIAVEDDHLEVKFNYCYNALIKAGIALIAAKGGMKTRSVIGHHVKIIEKIAEILKDNTVLAVGNAMRTKRNEDFYGGGIFISEKESAEYLEYVKSILEKARQLIK